MRRVVSVAGVFDHICLPGAWSGSGRDLGRSALGSWETLQGVNNRTPPPPFLLYITVYGNSTNLRFHDVALLRPLACHTKS